jgi:hypothetical protein
LGGGDPNDLPEDTQIEMLAYILHRRTPEGFLDSLAPASARDLVFLENMKVDAQNKASRADAGGPPELAEFRAMLEDAR